MVHPEDRFKRGEFIIHVGPSIHDDWSFSRAVNRVVEDDGTHMVIEHTLAGRIFRFIVYRGEWPTWKRCSPAMIRGARKDFRTFEKAF